MSQDDSDSCGGMEIVEDEIIASSPQTNNKNKAHTEDEDIIVDEEIITNKEGSGTTMPRRRKSFRPNQFQVSFRI